MKKTITVLILTTICFACQKNTDIEIKNKFLISAKNTLKIALPVEEFNQVDFDNNSTIELNKDIAIIILPIKNSLNTIDKIILKINAKNDSIDAKRTSISEIKKFGNYSNNILEIKSLYSNTSSRYLVDKINSSYTEIVKNMNHAAYVNYSISDEFYAPPAIVFSSNSIESNLHKQWINLNLFFKVQNPNLYIQYDFDLSGGPSMTHSIVEIDFEDIENKEAVDVFSLLDCFDKVDNAGASYTMTISSDIPIDNHPELPIVNQAGSPGHVFITLSKKNNNLEVVQNIGFYPIKFNAGNVRSKIVNDGKHEINATYLIALNENEFSIVLNKIKTSSIKPYNFVDYNCANFALDVFNSFGENLKISEINNSKFLNRSMFNTPSAVYAAIKDLSYFGNKNAKSFLTKEYAKPSNGPCKY